MNQKRNHWKNPILLLMAAIIWGVAFVAQSVGMDYVGPFTFNGVRSLLGAAVLVPVIMAFSGKKGKAKKNASDNKTLWTGGILCGLCLCAATTFQQIGIQYTTAGKAGFLTAMYIVLVPVFGMFLGKKCTSFIWVSIALATAGLYLLSIKDGFAIGIGDIYVMICAVIFTMHILIIDRFAPKCDGVKLSCIQFLVCGVICTAVAFMTETPVWSDIWAARLPIGYAGIMSCGVAYTLQIIGQKNMNPTVASLILCLESVVAVLAGWLILQQALSGRELIGCVIMFAAIILAQLPEKRSA